MLINVPTQVEMCLDTKQKNVQETGIVFNLFTETLAKFIVLVLVGLALSLKNLHFVWKQFQVAMNDFHQRISGNPHFL